MTLLLDMLTKPFEYADKVFRMMQINIPEEENVDDVLQSIGGSPAAYYSSGQGFIQAQLDQLFAICELNGPKVSPSSRERIRRL